MFISLIFLSMMFTLVFFFSTNPFSLGMTLICQTIVLSLLLSNLTKSFWFLYLLMLIFIGGMLVLFIYVVTIFPNEKFIFNQPNILFMIFWVTTSTLFIMIFMWMFNINIPYNNMFLNLNLTNENLDLKPSLKMFLSYSNVLIFLLVNYLFYCMIVVIKIVNFFKGPLRVLN